MSKHSVVSLHKPRRMSRQDLVELYQDETTTAAEPDTSVVKMLNDVMPKAGIPDTNYAIFDVGGIVKSVVMHASVAGHAIGSAIGSIGGDGSGALSSGSSDQNPPAN